MFQAGTLAYFIRFTEPKNSIYSRRLVQSIGHKWVPESPTDQRGHAFKVGKAFVFHFLTRYHPL